MRCGVCELAVPPSAVTAKPRLEDLNTDASAFVAEEVEPLALAAIDAVLKDSHYDEGRVEAQASAVCEDVVAALAALKKPFKYIGARRAPLARERAALEPRARAAAALRAPPSGPRTRVGRRRALSMTVLHRARYVVFCDGNADAARRRLRWHRRRCPRRRPLTRPSFSHVSPSSARLRPARSWRPQ